MEISQRRQRHKASLKKAILDAALQIIEKEGYHGVTIRRIAHAIEYSIPTVYEFFDNKEMLFRELKRDWLQKMVHVIEKIHAEERNPEIALEKIALAYTQNALENASHYKAVMGAENEGSDFAEIQSLRTILKSRIQAIATDKKLDDKVDILRSYLHGVVSLALTKKMRGGESRCYELVKEGVSGLIETWKN